MSKAAMLLVLSAGATVAQAQTGPAAASGSNVLGEVVVTATKQASSINKVPLSIVAVSQRDIDRQGIKSIADIVRETPALSYQVPANGDAIPSISIRGIASTIGAQTTGIYLDDAALQKRNAIGISGSGSPIPTLFDLDRVEVLRGPQGTLYGGSSEGGAIRFITPTPSLTHYSAYGKAEAATTEDGSPSYGGGVAVGGPIIQDKLGFRASVYGNHTGGYIDHVDLFTGKTLSKDTNYQDDQAVRLAMLWQATPDLKITPSFYASYSKKADGDVYWSNVPQSTVPGSTTGSYVQPTYTYGPYNTMGAYKIAAGCNVGQNYASTIPQCVITTPRISYLMVPSLAIEDQIGSVNIKSVTSYMRDETKGNLNYSYNAQFALGGPPFVADLPVYAAVPYFRNRRSGLTEELRFSSAPSDQRLSWIAGVYLSDSKNVASYYLPQLQNEFTMATTGRPTVTEPGSIVYHRYQVLNESEVAGFGEVNYKVTSKLKLIAGVRVSGSKYSYYQDTAGSLAGFLVPTVANGGLTNGSLQETPVTPKFGVQYQLNDRDMLYATAAEGYRLGGVNQPPPAARCASDLATLGITSTPATYASDHLWSYEVGAKARTADHRGELNASAFYIDWKNIQTAFSLPNCGFGYNVNAGGAVSQGFDLQGQYLVVKGLKVSGQVAYTDAHYTTNVFVPNTPYLVVQQGDRLPVAPWTINLAVEYNFDVGRYASYIRADYQYSTSYQAGSGPLTVNYAPDIYTNPATRYATARAGVVVSDVDLSVFVNNLFDSRDSLSQFGGRNSCENVSCSVYDLNVVTNARSTFQPRTVGVTATYRY